MFYTAVCLLRILYNDSELIQTYHTNSQLNMAIFSYYRSLTLQDPKSYDT